MPLCDKPPVPEGFQDLLEELTFESRRGPNGTFITKRATAQKANDDPLGNDRALHLRSCPRELL
uniref:Engrailed n=1 Tax=Mesocestoides corti TaxID=53468 RepID=A0A5K3FHM5_MESCO